ncbi:MAG: BamA/TamA family outer membrane protein [Candidatus Kapaibacteriales bacterium]
MKKFSRNVNILTSILLTLFFFNSGYSQDTLRSSIYNPELYEIDELIFEGNKYFPADQLSKIVLSKPSEKSLPNQIFIFFYKNLKDNPSSPTFYTKQIKNAFQKFIDEISFYYESRVENDAKNLYNFYYQNGFHNVEIKHQFSYDKTQKKNILRFIISEGLHYTIASIEYKGLDSLPLEVSQEIKKYRTLTIGSPYNEIELFYEISKIRNLLRDNGFYFADVEIPIVIIDTINKIDTIIVNFIIGKRQRIGEIIFEDSVDNQKRVGFNVKMKQMDLKPGDYFSQRKIVNSELNLNSLGTFESVRIDTFHIFEPSTDTTLNLLVSLKYRKQQDIGTSIFTNRTTVEKAINLGVEISYLHRNILGGAQSANIFLRGFIVDFSRTLFEKKQLEYEYQTGISFAQPLLWVIGSARVSFSGQILFSQRKIYNKLLLNTFSLPIKFPSKLPFWTYFGNINFDFSFERQKPIKFDQALADFSKEAKTLSDSIRILEALSIYGNLDRYYKTYNPLFTSTLFGITLTADKRNNPIMPERGSLTNISFDGFLGVGISKYYRISLSTFWFKDLTKSSVLAWKVRFGHIFWFNRTESFIPLERQFFAGGANSIRGWASRQLRFTRGQHLDTSSAQAVNSFLRDFVGNASLFESTLEMRFRLTRPTRLSKTIASIIELLTFTLFLDIGNAFQWLVLSPTGDYLFKYNLKDYIVGQAVAGGFGLGFVTPISPICIDFGFPIFDPNKEKKAFQNMVFHIRLGYSFY